MNRCKALLAAIVLVPTATYAKVIEDGQYKFRADLPGRDPSDPTKDYKLEDFETKGGTLTWRSYTSAGPVTKGDAAYTAAVKVFDTDSTNVRLLFNAGERDAEQSIGATLIGRAAGTFGHDKLPSVTLTYAGTTISGEALKGKVLLIVKGARLYAVTFYFAGTDQTAVGDKFFQSFEILN